jgi:GNAT superfamily N-acetyltransferase
MVDAQSTEGSPVSYRVRRAEERDLDRLVELEVEIATLAFADRAVTDQGVHRKRLSKALRRGDAGMFVAEDAAGRAVGWLWLALNTNALTGDRNAACRSLAVRPDADTDRVLDALLAHAVDHARRHGAGEIVGRVYLAEPATGAAYSRHGFAPAHLTMHRRSGA